jgi:V8-like Glu-specific endopeptidase
MRFVRGNWRSALLVSTLMAGCAADAVPEVVSQTAAALSTQCGPVWDGQDVEAYNGNLGVSQAFVKRAERHVGWGVHTGCSGTLIGDDLYLSAGHCQYAVGETIRFNYQKTPDRSRLEPASDYQVTQIVAQEDEGEWDYALMRLAGKPGLTFGYAQLGAVEPPAGTWLALIGHAERKPKEITTGPLLDYNSVTISGNARQNWFRFVISMEGGDSGSGILNSDGQIIGLALEGACNSRPPIGANTGLLISRLAQHSPAIAALTRTRIVLQHTSGLISQWTLNPDLSFAGQATNLTPLPGFVPVSFAENKLLLRHPNGTIQLWGLDAAGNYSFRSQAGPIGGWTALGFASNRILWVENATGRASIWFTDENGNHVTNAEYGPFPGYRPVSFASNRILWRNASGGARITIINDAGAVLGQTDQNPGGGWAPLSYGNGDLMWKNAGSGQLALWTVDLFANMLIHMELGPYAGINGIGRNDGKVMWKTSDERLWLWSTGIEGNFLGQAVFGAAPGWSPLFTAGNRP